MLLRSAHVISHLHRLATSKGNNWVVKCRARQAGSVSEGRSGQVQLDRHNYQERLACRHQKK